MTTHEILLAAQAAKLPLALADTDTKNAALEAMAVALVENSDAILAANKQDLAAARGRISDVMLDRLALTPARLADMAKGMREVAALPDPVGAVLRKIVRPNGLLIEKTSVPMGVIAIIYESRPNVTSDAAALALKAAHEAGINYIDTARAYTVSEEWIGQALEELGLRDEFILATKCRALTKAEMEAELAASLKNLRTDHIDLYQFHNPSPQGHNAPGSHGTRNSWESGCPPCRGHSNCSGGRTGCQGYPALSGRRLSPPGSAGRCWRCPPHSVPILPARPCRGWIL